MIEVWNSRVVLKREELGQGEGSLVGAQSGAEMWFVDDTIVTMFWQISFVEKKEIYNPLCCLCAVHNIMLRLTSAPLTRSEFYNQISILMGVQNTAYQPGKR